jgi:hypothetical protein
MLIISKSNVNKFKHLSKEFSVALEQSTGVRLRGRKLLDSMARAAGHSNYASLVIRSKGTAEQVVDWESITDSMSENLSLSLELEPKTVFSALSAAKNVIAGYQHGPDGYVFSAISDGHYSVSRALAKAVQESETSPLYCDENGNHGLDDFNGPI